MYPEHDLPDSFEHIGAVSIIHMDVSLPKFILILFQLRNLATNQCLDTMGAKHKLEMHPCHNLGGNQMWLLTNSNEIRNNEYCVDGVKISGEVEMGICHKSKGNQHWTYDEMVSVTVVLCGFIDI